MSAFPLLTSLRGYLAPLLAELPLATHERAQDARVPEGQIPCKPCKVLIGSMPPTTQDALSAAPFALLQLLEGRRDENGIDQIRLAIRICIVNSEHEAAENDLHNLISQIRLWLCALPGGVIGKTFRLEPDCELEWNRPDEQFPPFLQAVIFTNWQTRAAGAEVSPYMVDYE